MSNPPNPLAEYRSVSYYHVLAVCDTTETAAKLSSLTDEDVWRHASPSYNGDVVDPNDYANYGKYAPKNLRLDAASGSQQKVGRYSILVDGSSDADFSITEANWVATTTGAATPQDRGTSIAVEGSIQISEPRGVVFADTIVSICKALKINSANAVFVLKTFFVGHLHSTIDESTTPATITDIDPYVFTVIDLKGSYSDRGSNYHVACVGIQHGTGRLPQYSRVNSSISVKTGTLVETFGNLQRALETNYDKLFACARSTIFESVSDIAIRDNVLSRLSKVKYVIELDKEYQSSEYFVSASPLTQDHPACSSGGSLTYPAQTSIEDMIRDIMDHCAKVQQELAQSQESAGRVRDPRYMYKVHANVESAKGEDSNTGQTINTTLTYRIERYPEPMSFNFYSALLDETEDTSDEGVQRIKNNTMEFDYIYTGKNIDIIDFDMNMTLGLAYLQIATSANSTRDHLNPNPVNKQSLPNNIVVPNDGTPIPIFFGSNIVTNAFRNTNSPSAGIQSAYTLAKHSSLESIEVSMRIYGNPGLLNRVNKTSLRYTNADQQTSVGKVLADFTHHPAFAKIKIRMPRTNDDIALFQAMSGGEDADDFTKEFWFDGYYYIYGITNVFDNGFFYQQLHMLGIPSRMEIENSADSQEFDLKLNNSIGKCYDVPESADGEKPTPSVSTPPPANVAKDRQEKEQKKHVGGTAVAPKKQQHAKPTNAADAHALLAAVRGSGTETVYGYDAASDDVKQAIQSAPKHSGHPMVDATVIARIASAENSLKASGKTKLASTGTATGLFQFVESTWVNLGKQGKIPGIARAEAATAESLNKRSDPKYAAAAEVAMLTAEANALTAGNVPVNETTLYVMHHFGRSDGLAILKSIYSGNGNARLEDVLSTKRVANIKKYNPQLQYATSAQDILDYSAMKMASTVVTGIKVNNTTPAQLSTSETGPAKTPVQTTQAGVTAGEKLLKTQTGNKKKPADKTKPCPDTPAGVNSKGKVQTRKPRFRGDYAADDGKPKFRGDY